MARFCRECGDSHECTAELEADDAKTRIRLAEIDRDRAIRIAELELAGRTAEAAAVVDIAAAEAVSDTAEAEGRADGMETVLGDLSPGGGAEDQAPAEVPAEEFPAGTAGAAVETVAPIPDMAHESKQDRKDGGWFAGYPG
jgi:hypothetical protein